MESKHKGGLNIQQLEDEADGVHLLDIPEVKAAPAPAAVALHQHQRSSREEAPGSWQPR